MKNTIAIVLLLAATGASAQNWFSTQPLGGMTSGSLYGQQLNATTQRYGSSAYTNGTIGGESFQNNSWDTGTFRFDNGSVGGRSYSCTTTRVGSFITTTCN
jgi:hypothetical protein